MTKEGLRQNGGLSPMPFRVFMNEIIKKCNKQAKRYALHLKLAKNSNI